MEKDAKGSKLDSWISFFEMIITIKYVIPSFIILLFIMILIGCIPRVYVWATADKETTITYSDFRETVSEIALEVVNTSEFDIEIEEYSSGSSNLEIIYTVKDLGKTAEEYDALVKEEITKIYNEIKDKELVNNTLFGEIENVDIKFTFKMYLNDGNLKYLAIKSIKYGEDNWSSSYQEVMNTTIVTQEKIDKINEES